MMSCRDVRLAACAAALIACAGCQTMYYSAMEKVGIHKRDLMVDRVKGAQNSQKKAKEEFKSALEQFRSVVNFKGGNLEKQYNKLAGVLEDCESRAKDVRDRIDSIENVSDALFREWKAELGQYTNAELRRSSEQKLRETRMRYEELIAAMKRAESRMDPVLNVLRDQVLYLKHNLNAQAVASLKDELATVETNVERLVKDMEAAIGEADAFIRQMGSTAG